MDEDEDTILFGGQPIEPLPLSKEESVTAQLLLAQLRTHAAHVGYVKFCSHLPLNLLGADKKELVYMVVEMCELFPRVDKLSTDAHRVLDYWASFQGLSPAKVYVNKAKSLQSSSTADDGE